MKPTLYLETSIIGYLTSRPSEMIVTAANQQLTRRWWDERRGDYELYVSHYVTEECRMGDVQAAADRIAAIEEMPLLEVNDEVTRMAGALVSQIPLPPKAAIDAYHIAVAAVHGIQYLLTWNCKHISNPSHQKKIDLICRSRNYEPPTICSPQQLLELF